jgi:hypothetical protein
VKRAMKGVRYIPRADRNGRLRNAQSDGVRLAGLLSPRTRKFQPAMVAMIVIRVSIKKRNQTSRQIHMRSKVVGCPKNIHTKCLHPEWISLTPMKVNDCGCVRYPLCPLLENLQS